MKRTLHARKGSLLFVIAVLLLAMFTPGTAQAAGEQFNVSATSGRPGVAVQISQGDPCPTVGDFSQRVEASFTDAAGTTIDFYTIINADPPGTWSQQAARVTIPPSAAQGVGSLAVRCKYWDGENDNLTLLYTPRAYTVSGTAPQFTSTPAQVQPGQAVTLMSTDPCPSDRVDGSIHGDQVVSNFHAMLDSSGAWVVGVATSSEYMGTYTPFPPGTYTITAYCLDDTTAQTTQWYANQQVVVGEVTPPVSDCKDVLFLAVAGSGQQFDGAHNLSISPELVTAYDGFRAVLPNDKKIKIRVVKYPALPVETLTKQLRYKKYLDGKNQGVNRVYSEVAESRRECPGRPIVVAGFSQGALVVHEFMVEWALGATQAELDAITAAILVANPARHENSAVVDFGDAPWDSKGICQYFGGGGCFKDVAFGDIPSAFAARTTSVCRNLDIVCDTEHLTTFIAAPKEAYEEGVRVHGSYADTQETKLAGKRAARQVMRVRGW